MLDELTFSKLKSEMQLPEIVNIKGVEEIYWCSVEDINTKTNIALKSLNLSVYQYNIHKKIFLEIIH